MLAAGSVSGSWQGMCAEGQRKERQGRYFPSQQKYFTAHRPWDYTAPDMNLHTPDLCTHQTSAHTESPWVGTQALLVVASPRLHTQYHTSAGHGGQKGLCPLLRGRAPQKLKNLLLITLSLARMEPSRAVPSCCPCRGGRAGDAPSRHSWIPCSLIPSSPYPSAG